MTPETLAALRAALAPLRELEPPPRFFSPALTPRRLVAEVAPDGTLGVVHLRRDPEQPQLAELRVARFAVPPPRPLPWRTVWPRLAQASHPWLLFGPGEVQVGCNGLLEDGEAARRRGGAEHYLFRPDADTPGRPQRLLERVRDAVVPAPAAGGLCLLYREWYPPPADPVAVRLLLTRIQPDGVSAFSARVPGTDRPGSYPVDYAVYGDGAGPIHVTFDGVPPDEREAAAAGQSPEAAGVGLTPKAGGPSWLWHAVFDPTGRLLAGPSFLGQAPPYPLLSRILTDAAGRLVLFRLHRPGKDKGPAEPLVFPLEGAKPGRAQAQHVLVDGFLQVHLLRFTPDGTPQHQCNWEVDG